MRKTALVTISILIAFMFSSCSDSTEDLTEANTLAAFDVTEFASKGINEYFENPQITGEAEFSASFSSSRSVNDNGSATILASFRDYPYNDYTVTGDFIYTLPVESGRILGYRMETASGSSPTFKDKKDQETQFSITMDETALAPAGGDYNTVTNTVSNGIAMPMLEGTEATFTVGTSSISLDDIPKEEEPYNRSMIAEDLYSLMMANGPLSGYAIKLLKEQLPSTGMSGGTYTANLGNGNTYTITYDAENMSSHAELKIINPMDFIVTDSTGRSYSVHTNGKVSVTGGGSAEGKGSGEVEYKDFVSTIIVTGDTDPVTYTSPVSESGIIHTADNHIRVLSASMHWI